jgi:hypothetical protein
LRAVRKPIPRNPMHAPHILICHLREQHRRNVHARRDITTATDVGDCRRDAFPSWTARARDDDLSPAERVVVGVQSRAAVHKDDAIEERWNNGTYG